MYKLHIRIDAATKLRVVAQAQRGSHSFEHAVVESFTMVVICYHFLLKRFEENDHNYSSDCISQLNGKMQVASRPRFT